METVVYHYWVQHADGSPRLYEALYARYPLREGLECHVKVPHSERPCACPKREGDLRQTTPAQPMELAA